jgi:Yip1 domain
LPNVVGATLANIAASILAVWVVLPIAAGVYHVFVRLLIGPSNRGYRATFRVLAYAGAAELVGWVPFVGLLLAAVWAVSLATLGLRELHATTASRALAALAVASLVLAAVAAAGVAGVMFGPSALEQLASR